VAAGALVLVAVAAELGRREAFVEILVPVPGGLGRWLLQVACAGIAGLCGAATALLIDPEHTEARLLMAGAVGFLAAVSALSIGDRLDRRSGGVDRRAAARALPD
jgi:hypothetical protein